LENENSGIAIRFKIVRRQAGLNQKELAVKLGLSPELLGQFESGWRYPRGIYIKVMCNLFDIREDWLVHGEGDMRLAKEDAEEISTMASEIVYLLKNAPKSYSKSLLDFLIQSRAWCTANPMPSDS
jgi:transcriptional regulator with XRE-family HTH domain